MKEIDVEKILKDTLNEGATEAEIFRIRTREVTLRTSSKIESSKTVTLESIGIRAVVGKSYAIVGTQNITSQGIKDAVRAAVSIAKVSPEDPDWLGLNDKVSKTPLYGLWDRETAEADPLLLKDKAEEAFQAINEKSTSTRLVRGGFTAGETIIELLNNYEGPVSQSFTSAIAWMYVKASEEGKEGTYSEFDAKRSIKELVVAEKAAEAAERSLHFVNAKKITTGEYAVVLAPEVVSSIIGVMISPAISANNVQQGRSPLAGKIGNEIVSPKLTLTDIGCDPSLLGAKEFDDEGYPTKKTIVLQDGVLKNYLYDTYTARKDRVESTGNAHRSYTSSPTPAPNHLYISPGESSTEELISTIRRGVLIMKTIGEWLSNYVSGKLNATITHGYIIENGEITGTFKGGVLSADFYEVFRKNLKMISKETRQFPGATAPYLMLENVKIAGE